MSESAPIQRILFPTDFSPTSDAAFEYAARLAAATGAELLVLHVTSPKDVWGAGGKSDDLDSAERKLNEIPRPPDVQLRTVTHAGPPGQVICWMAQDRQCDQIVMGTHGHTGVSHLVLGSVAEYVVRHARCPVLTVRRRSKDEKPLKEPHANPPQPPMV